MDDAVTVFDPPMLVTVPVNSWRPQACGGAVVDDTLYLVGGRGTNYMVVSKDGRTFEDVRVEPGRGLRAIVVEGERTWIVGESGTLLASEDGRKSFSSLDTGTGGCLYTIAREPGGDLWIGGDDGYLARLRGDQVTKVGGIDGNVNQLLATPFGFLAATNAGLFRIEGGKATATSLKHPLYKLLVTNAGTLLAVGHDNAAFRSTDGGETFSASKVPPFVKTRVPEANQRELPSWERPQQGLYAAAQLPDGPIVVSGEQGVVLWSSDDGVTFSRVAHDLSESVFEVAIAFRGAIYLGGDHRIVMRLRPVHARPGRPAQVPAAAVHDPKDAEWELGERNAAGKPVGPWKYWLEEGSLVCEAAYDADGRLTSLVRFHPDGTAAQKVSFQDGAPHGVAHYQRAEGPSSELPIPYEAPANVFRMEYVWNEGKVESTRFWDVNGDEIDAAGDITNPVRRGDVPEEATFDPENKVWVLEPVDEAGDVHGIARWWRPSGALIEEHRYEHGRPVYQRRFHPHGALAFERLYSDKTHIPTMNTRWATEEPTDIDFPRGGGLAPSIMKTQYVYDDHGYIDHWVGFDADGNEVTREAVNRSHDARIEQATYASLEEAAAEWNAKGDAFYAALNAFIAQNYIAAEGEEEEEEEEEEMVDASSVDEEEDDEEDDEDDEIEHPTDERGHMERFVLRAIEKLSAEGPGRARAMFKPSFEPFCEDVWRLGKTIHKIAALPGKLLVNAADEVYVVEGDRIERQADVGRFGISRNKRFLAQCYDARIDVLDRERGTKIHTFAYPKHWGDDVMKAHPDIRLDAFRSMKTLRIVDVLVGNDGSFVVLVTERGVFFLQPNRARLLFPPPEKSRVLPGIRDVVVETEGGAPAFDLRVNDPRAALSLDEKTLVMSGDYGPYDPMRAAYVFDAAHADGAYTQEDTWESGPFTPSHFHSNGQRYLAGMVEHQRGFFGTGGSTESLVFTFDMAYVRARKTSLLEGAGRHAVRTSRLTAVTELADRFLIGMDDSYVWAQGIDENTQEYVFCGLAGTYGEITCLEVSDGAIFVGTNYGAVWHLSPSDEPGEGFVTNMKLRDERRYLFLDTFRPMIW